MQKIFLFFTAVLFSSGVLAADYPVSLFGIKSDGITLNTNSIQHAIDFIGAKGGGRLMFGPGRFLTGSIHLKSGVVLFLGEGAVLLGSLNPFDYERHGFTALIFADSAEHIGIIGKGIIDGQGRQVALNTVQLIHSGVIQDPLVNDRPAESNRPMLIYFHHCSAITVENITLTNAASWVQTYDQCRDLMIDDIRVESKAYWNNDGFDIVDCNGVKITRCFIDAADDGICLKSHDAGALCTNVLVRDCTIRSSANAIKFGTASYGGFSHIQLIHNKVYDTYRSAIALEAVDGGCIEDVWIDSLEAVHTGNAFFLRVGKRNGIKQSCMHDIHFSNIHVSIAANKPDSGYAYEGPVEDQPRNISPAVITGQPGNPIRNVSLQHIFIESPGGGNNLFANSPLETLDSIPELPAKYPEFSMFKELPAWGIFIRHCNGVQATGIVLRCWHKDYRPAVVLDDVQHAKFNAAEFKGVLPKNRFYLHHAEDVDFRFLKTTEK